ncbi:MAG: hypothetical protein RI973_1147 [Bacteroidota bacterium]|jgi:sugar lactone lactonase YvrE
MKTATSIYLLLLSIAIQQAPAATLHPSSPCTEDWISCHHWPDASSKPETMVAPARDAADACLPGNGEQPSRLPPEKQVATINPVRAYVTQNGAGNMDGSSWDDAFSANQLITALATALEVWVAAGTYFPTPVSDPNNQGYAFIIRNGMKFYGGFAGTETDISQRNIASNPTILSGDIGIPGLNFDNSDFIVDFFNLGAVTSMDGFIIKDAHNDDNLGPVRINYSTVRITNCQIIGNTSMFSGGLSIDNSTVIVDRCRFENNNCDFGGGAITAANTTLSVFSSAFLSNKGSNAAGAYYGGSWSNTSFVNCLFNGNVTYTSGGSAVFIGNPAYLTLTNCTVVNNMESPAIGSTGLPVYLENCIVWGNSHGSGANFSLEYSMLQEMGQNPMFVGPNDFHLQPCSPAVNAGGNYLIAGYPTDMDGNPRIYNGFVVDMGAYELQDNPIHVIPFDVGGGGASCNNSLEPITLSNSQLGVDYQLRHNGGDVGSPLPGTGAPLNLGMPAFTGTYTVAALSSSGCTGNMSGSASAWIGPLETNLVMDTYLSGDTIALVTDDDRPLSSIAWKLNDSTVFMQPDGFAPDAVTIAGGNGLGSGTLNQIYPLDIFIAPGDTLYVAEEWPNYRVTKWAPGATEGVLVAGGNGPGFELNKISHPSSIWVDANRNLYISDAFNDRVVKWAPGATEGVIVAGNGIYGSGASELASPRSIFLDISGNLYVTDQENHRVQKWAPGASEGITVAGGNSLGNATNQLTYPKGGLWVDDNGDIYVTDNGNARIMKWAPGAASGTVVPFAGALLGDLWFPNDLRLDSEGRLLVCDDLRSRVLRWKPGETGYSVAAGGNDNGNAANQLSSYLTIDLNAAGELYVSDRENCRVQKFSRIFTSLKLLADTCGSWSTITTDTFGCVDTSMAIQVLTRWYADSDGDGYGNISIYEDFCQLKPGYIRLGHDCNDNDAAVNPGAQEECNDGIDNNCDGRMHETPPVTVSDSLLTGCSGETVQVNSSSGLVRWHDAPVGGKLLSQGPSADVQLTVLDTVYIEAFDPQFEQLNTVKTDAALYYVDTDTLSGDDGRGLAVTPDYVFYTGDDFTVRYDHQLQNGVRLAGRIDGMFSDLCTGKLYGLLYRDTSTYFADFNVNIVNCIVAYNYDGTSTGDTTLLSQPIANIGCYSSAIFNGCGYFLLYANNQNKVFRVDLPSGHVSVINESIEFGNELETAESCWYWGMSTYSNFEYTIIYHPRTTQIIKRLNLKTQEADTVTVFEKKLGSGQLGQFIYSPWHSLLYWHFEGDNEYSGNIFGEWLLAFEATAVSLAECDRTPVTVLHPIPCPAPPMPLVRAGNAPFTTAVASWTPATTCNNTVKMDLYWSDSPAPPDSLTPATFSNLAGDSLLIEFLQPDTVYYAWVRSRCGAGCSEWTGPVAYTVPGLDSLLVTTTPGSLCDGQAFMAQVELPQAASVAWFDAPAGGNQLDTGAIASFIADMEGVLYAEITIRDSAHFSQQFNLTRSQQMFVVPNDVSKISVIARGARGGMSFYNCNIKDYGKGGTVEADISVSPGDTFYLYVGGAPAETSLDSIGTGGYNGGGGGDYYGGGGGGASDIRMGGNGLGHRILVAGGGGGTISCNYSSQGNTGGAGGGLTGGDGAGYWCSDCGGKGGTQTNGGAGGIGTYFDGSPGGFGYGGSIPYPFYYYCEAAGGGGGYYGGGSGGYCSSGGGGGSSYADSTLFTNVVHTQGNHDGDGEIIFNYFIVRTYKGRTLVPVADTLAPVALCQDVTTILDTMGHASVAAVEVDNNSSDACGIASRMLDISSFDCDDLAVLNGGGNTVTLTVTDVNGNSSSCTALVIVADTILPLAKCQNKAIQVDAEGMASITAAQINNGSSDNCAVSLALSQSSFSCSQLGANQMTLTVTDTSGNSSTCSATVTVQDKLPPVALCKNITVFLDAAGVAGITPAQMDNGSSDNCGTIILSLDKANFDCSNLGANAVLLTAMDQGGNAGTCNATVTVMDNLPPVLVCQDITVQVNSQGMVSVNPLQVFNAGASSDNCGTVIPANLSTSQFYCINQGTNAVMLTASDGHGNTATCHATVTVLGLIQTFSVEVTPEFCGSTLGSISVNHLAINGQVGYSINGGGSWQFSNVFGNVNAGNYSLVVSVFGTYGCGLPPTTVTVPLMGELTNTWTGNGDGMSWMNDANWSLGHQPISCHDVVIPAGFDVLLPAGEAAVGRTLTVEMGGILTVEHTATLSIEND